ncbi:hypothetical protein DSECCO2_595480 [anaerobic digester metagenome]
MVVTAVCPIRFVSKGAVFLQMDGHLSGQFTRRLINLCVVGFFNNDLFQRIISFFPDKEKFLEEACIGIGTHDYGVCHGLVGQENPQRKQDHRTEPHADPMVPNPVTRHFIAYVIENVIDDEQNHRNDDGCSQASLTDDRTQWRSDKEKNEAGKRYCKLGVPLDPLPVYISLCGCFGH